MSYSINIAKMATYLNVDFIGENLIIESVVGISSFKSNSMSFINKVNYKEDISIGGLIFVLDDYIIDDKSKNSYILSQNPRYDFVKVFNKFFKQEKKMGICATVIIGENCRIGKNVIVGEYCVIKDNVSIGDGSVINNHVVIESNNIIGNDCYIKSGAIIGEDGFGFVKDENGIPMKFPHIGNVVIGNNVEIGAKTTIARGTLESTVIRDNVKIDDQVFIAHNVFIDENTMIVACSEVSGSAKIGKNCWVGPNSTIRDGITIGDNVFLGMATVVSKNIETNSKLASLSDLSYRDIIGIKKLVGK